MAELEGWRRFALQRLGANPDRGTGILVVRNEQDCIVGIAAFQLADDMIHGPVLVADLFCAIDIVDQANVARALENELEKVTRRHGCRAVHTNLPSSGSKGAEDWLVPVLYERGHRVEALQLCKRISEGS
ncbi:MAG TPA: hypothetical protein VIR45_09695 [Kiloniellaceae bacterium]